MGSSVLEVPQTLSTGSPPDSGRPAHPPCPMKLEQPAPATPVHSAMKHFHPFRLDGDNFCLWRADARVPLSPKAFALLRYLVERPRRLVCQNELIAAAGKNLDVQQEILKKYILEIRKALGDQSDAPVYIETLPRLGYRFIAEVHETPAELRYDAANAALAHLVGRDRERTALRASLEQAAAGHGHFLCLSGGTGTGKTALAEELLLDARGRGAARVMRGRCSEHVAGAEPYHPIWEALEGLLDDSGDHQPARALKTVAPSWQSQLAGTEEPPAAQNGPRQRMPREFAALLQRLASERPLVLFIDDLHWADPSTVDLLAYLAGRLAPWRILILVTCRPAELTRTRHPFAQLKLLLQARGVCKEVRLAPLSRQDTEQYISLEFGRHRLPGEFARLVHDSTDGNPLFMVELLRHLRERGVIAETDAGWALVEELPHFDRDLPESIRSALQRKIDQLDDADRWLLSAAAVLGREFDSAVLARILDLDAAEVEERLVSLEQRHGLARIVKEAQLPDGAKMLCCCFVHALCQSILYASLTPSRRAALSAAVSSARHPGERCDVVR